MTPTLVLLSGFEVIVQRPSNWPPSWLPLLCNPYINSYPFLPQVPGSEKVTHSEKNCSGRRLCLESEVVPTKRHSCGTAEECRCCYCHCLHPCPIYYHSHHAAFLCPPVPHSFRGMLHSSLPSGPLLLPCSHLSVCLLQAIASDVLCLDCPSSSSVYVSIVVTQEQYLERVIMYGLLDCWKSWSNQVEFALM